MKYLVTGAAGFIGSATVEMLLGQGHEVVGVDNMNDYYDVRLKAYRLRHIAEVSGGGIPAGLRDFEQSAGAADYRGPDAFNAGGFAFLYGDIENRAMLESLFAGHRFDAVINLAARAGVRYSMVNPFVYMTTNAMGVLNLLECMRQAGVVKFVQASTSSLYAGQAMPFVETMPVNEPISPYAASKKAAEAMAYAYHHLYGLDVSVLRYFTVYGPAGRPDMSIFRFIKWIDEGHPVELFGDGTQSRDFTYVDDIASGTIAALKPLGYEIINLGGGHAPETINHMIASFERYLGKTAVIDHMPVNKSDMKDTSADISKAKSLLGWKPLTPTDEGFRKSVEWHVAHRNFVNDIRV
jgi:nucleoside-diphosphate-sugar epimerase